ncbi:hypothetical protein [Flavobacterium columnare]|uniref:hypothetical protein n=2 Tax=Flavobacterium columnare TaxID=996 RepID=UPI00110108C0|nr:hypothetical protein [Flavobacterium columnare]MCH4829689.1 hypothetical protein [Flavobacterium columnare]
MMLKAHSLLYAIYICLLISIICGALLYFFNLYSLLNLHYNLEEELYIQNQSALNFALGNNLNETTDFLTDENNSIHNSYNTKPYGLLNVVTTQSVFKNDTITATHLIGGYNHLETALYISNFTQNIGYNGIIKLHGTTYFPSNYISPTYLTNEINSFTHIGRKEISKLRLPEINPKFNRILEGFTTNKNTLNNNNKVKDSLFFNSFTKPTEEINIDSNLSNIIIKGNFILHNKDSIKITKSAILEDVIVVSPRITIEEGFKGNAQFIATQKINVGTKVILNYPSALILKSQENEETKIKIGKETKIFGTVVLFGNGIENISKNSISIEDKNLVVGSIYCTGKLDLQGTVYGSVFTNKVFRQTSSSVHENVLHNLTINITKKPYYFMDFPLFINPNTKYGVIKKLK